MDLCANEWKEIEKLEKKNKKLTNALILRNDELLKARDALRWRKYPEEKPKDNGDCLVTDYLGDIAVLFYSTEDELWCSSRIVGVEGIVYWLPIPPLEEK